MFGPGDTIEIEGPDFMFGDDGEMIQLSPRAPSRGNARAILSGGAGQNTRLRKEIEETLNASSQVSLLHRFTVLASCVQLLLYLASVMPLY